MAILNRIFVSALAALSLTSCFSDFEPNIDSTPVLCLNSLIVAGEPVQVTVTRTWRWDEGNPGSGMGDPGTIDINIRDAEVSLYVNDEFVETLSPAEFDNKKVPGWGMYDKVKGYESSYSPKSGDRVELRATSKKYGDATASVDVPYPVPFDKVEVTVRNFYDGAPYWPEDYQMDLSFRMWFSDPADVTNYYIFDFGWSGGGSSDISGGKEYFRSFYPDYSSEPLFTEHVSALESVFSDTSGYTIFSDRQISGKSYPLTFSDNGVTYTYSNPANDPALGNLTLDLTLGNISDSYYYHVLSVWEANDGITGSLGSVGLGEPVYPVSNVSTGAGVVAAVAYSTYKVRMLDIVKQQGGLDGDAHQAQYSRSEYGGQQSVEGQTKR